MYNACFLIGEVFRENRLSRKKIKNAEMQEMPDVRLANFAAWPKKNVTFSIVSLGKFHKNSEKSVRRSVFENETKKVPLAGVEPAAHGLGNHCSIHTEL